MRIIIPGDEENEDQSQQTTSEGVNQRPQIDRNLYMRRNMVPQASNALRYEGNPEKQEMDEGHPLHFVENRKERKKKFKKYKYNEMEDGYNSSDEQQTFSFSNPRHFQQMVYSRQEDFEIFKEELKRIKGLEIREMDSDGNCLFRSIADQVYGFPDMHDEVRARCIEYMRQERDHYSQFVTEDFEHYLERKSRDRCYGNNLEIQALGEIFNRPIEIYTYRNGLTMDPINIFHGQYHTDSAPIRLSYHNGNHYNSVVDPNNPTVGVGLGIPNYQPGLADRQLMQDALKKSEDDEIDQFVIETCKKETEMEETEKEIEEAILAASQREFEEQILRQSREAYLDQLKETFSTSKSQSTFR